MSYGNVLRAFKEFGVKDTFYKLFQSRTLKFGRLVGTDSLGNKYYENKKDYPFGEGGGTGRVAACAVEAAW